jgi:16S rRNA (cytidine1402-2'-O)-methyltransferase
MSGVLYLIPTPIGNWEDITLRAMRLLKDVDLIVCEEFKEGRALLRKIGIEKPLENLNEHNSAESTKIIVGHLLDGKSVALISDCGTPVFSDPGIELVQAAIRKNLRVVPLPGTSSLLPALTGSGFSIDSFLFVGWLSPKKELRRKQLAELKNETRTAVIMDTPYRLGALMNDMSSVLGPSREVSVAFDLTLPTEQFFRGQIRNVLSEISARKLKGEFVVVIKGERREVEKRRR